MVPENDGSGSRSTYGTCSAIEHYPFVGGSFRFPLQDPKCHVQDGAKRYRI
jgi:hypothetical protein